MAWQGNRGQRYASFNAQLVIDEQEQLKSIEELEIEANELIDVPEMFLEIDQDALNKKIIENGKNDQDSQGSLPL